MYGAVILTILCTLQILVVSGFFVLSNCDLELWPIDFKIQRVCGRVTVYIPATFQGNPLENNRDLWVQQILGSFLLVTLTFDL